MTEQSKGGKLIINGAGNLQWVEEFAATMPDKPVNNAERSTTVPAIFAYPYGKAEGK